MVKFQLFYKKALANVNYTKAEEYFHDALRLLETNEHATSHAFIEARAVVMDKVLSSCSVDKCSLLYIILF